ncbi:unnamed protein product, partial [Tenebrio molitor]
IINLGREILLLGSVRESIMTPSETSSEKKILWPKRRKFCLPEMKRSFCWVLYKNINIVESKESDVISKADK